MAPPTQKASARPISFVLHDSASGAAPVEVPLVIRPEDLSIAESSRLSVQQTLGGAWADSFGRGIPTVQLSGHTGWGAGNRPSGADEFDKLYTKVFKGWHKGRDKAVAGGLDPDKVRMIFSDVLDNVTWVVAPQTFVLKRSKSRPLLAQYQIGLTWLSDDAKDKGLLKGLDLLGGIGFSAFAKQNGLASLGGSIAKIDAAISSKISGFLGPAQGAFDAMAGTTSGVLQFAHDVISGKALISGSATGGLLGLASDLSRAAANATCAIAAISDIPSRIKAQFQTTGSAFDNANCLLGNVFKPRTFLPDYDGLYGASNCSSTSGGAPLSAFDTANPFPLLTPVEPAVASISPAAAAALGVLSRLDPVMAPLSMDGIALNMATIAGGFSLRG